MMANKSLILSAVLAAAMLAACTDDDTFTTSPSNLLTFSTDTIRMDTVFSTVPTSTRTFWVYNRSGDGIRCTNVRLVNGNQTGFRVNVDGEYLSPTAGYQVHDVESLLDHIIMLGDTGLLLDASVADICAKYSFGFRSPGEQADDVIYSEPSIHGSSAGCSSAGIIRMRCRIEEKV